MSDVGLPTTPTGPLSAIVENPRHLERGWSHIDGPRPWTGSSSTLPMSDEEKQAAREREVAKRPIGFARVNFEERTSS